MSRRATSARRIASDPEPEPVLEYFDARSRHPVPRHCCVCGALADLPLWDRLMKRRFWCGLHGGRAE